MIVLKSFLFFVGAAAACALIVLCLWVDMRFVGHDIPELSLTEIMQETVLASIVFLHFRLAKMYESMRYCNILVGGFFLTMLIRELDALFDLISHGSWVWFALITAVLALIRPVMHFRATLEQLAKYTQSPLVRYSVERPAGCTGLLPPLWNAGAVARHPGAWLYACREKRRGGRFGIVRLYAVPGRIPWLLRYLSRSRTTKIISSHCVERRRGK